MKFYPQIHRIDVPYSIKPELVALYVNAEVCRFINTLTLVNEKLMPRLTKVHDFQYEITYYSQLSYEVPKGIELHAKDLVGQANPYIASANKEANDTSKVQAATGAKKVPQGAGATARA